MKAIRDCLKKMKAKLPAATARALEARLGSLAGDDITIASLEHQMSAVKETIAQEGGWRAALETRLGIGKALPETPPSPDTLGGSPAAAGDGAPPVEPPTRMRPLNPGESGAASTTAVQALASTGLGAVAGGIIDSEDRLRGMTAGAATGLAAFGGKRLLNRAQPFMQRAAGQREQGKGRPMLERVASGTQRLGERMFSTNRHPQIDVSLQQGIGTANTIKQTAEDALLKVAKARKAAKLTQVQNQRIDAFLIPNLPQGARAAATQMLKAAGLPAEIEAAVMEAAAQKGIAQNIIMEAQRDPKRKQMIKDSHGEYQTRAYDAFVNPKDWKYSKKDFDQVVADNMASPQYRGMTRDAVERDLKGYIQEVRDFDGGFSLFMKRKELTPALKRLLGEITDPLEAEHLTVLKLASNVGTAKFVDDMVKLKGDHGLEFAMPASKFDAEIAAARTAGDTKKVEFMENMYERVKEADGLGTLAQGPREAMYAQRAVLDALSTSAGYGSNAGMPGWLDGIAKFMAAVNRVPKASFTLYNVGTWVHNFAQIPFQAMAAGINPLKMTGYWRMLDDAAVRRAAREDNMFAAHFGVGDFNKSATTFEKALSPGITGRVKNFHEAAKSWYGTPDKLVRGAAYVKFLQEAKKKGLGWLTPEARRYAVNETNRVTQNYSNVSNAVGIAKNIPGVNPFVSYTAEMLRVMKNLAEDVITNRNNRRIESAAGLLSLMTTAMGAKWLVEQVAGSEGDTKALEEIRSVLPDFDRAREKAATTNHGAVDVTPWTPAGDIMKFSEMLVRGDLDAAWASNPFFGARTPAVAMVNEMTTGRDNFTGKQNFDPAPKRILTAIQKNTLPSLFPGIPGVTEPNYRAKQLSEAFTENQAGGLGVSDPMRGSSNTPGSAMAGLFGVNAKKYDKGKLIMRRHTELNREIEDAKSKHRQIMRTDINQAAKDESLRRLIQRVKEINARRPVMK